MEKALWKFIDNHGTFVSKKAHKINTLYFPLCNDYPFMSSVSADLHGDIKTDFNSFLLQPVSRIDLAGLKSSRNFWIYISSKKIWSATGVSKDLAAINSDKFSLEGGLLWQKITRQNNKIGLKSEITSFVPSTGEPVEIMRVEITNISPKKIKFIPIAAIPLFARSAGNLRDHRHVTSLLSCVKKNKFGIIVTPTLLFNEKGHNKNYTSYFVFGSDKQSSPPQYIYPAQEEFTGDDSDLEAPSVVMRNLLPNKQLNPQGKEPMGALRFRLKTLNPKQKCVYTIVMGIVKEKTELAITEHMSLRRGHRPSASPRGEPTRQSHNDIIAIFKKFNSPEKIMRSFNTTKSYWQNKGCENMVGTQDADFDNWFRWVNIQPNLRKIFGCSFLPDFDYGKGGRGWRDLWQDCLSLILSAPQEVRPLLINNFAGVRIDGSNATIIGAKPGEFIADRNNISRVWMDHGIWPLLTTLLYIHQTKDLGILLEETSYFRDHQLCRGKERDWDWKPEYGNQLKTKTNQIYTGTILEHMLIQNLVQFFNVGPHNHIRLEGADWNDGLDMAQEHGESVAFTAMYARNLNILYEILGKVKQENIVVAKEAFALFDSLGVSPIDYSDIRQKHQTLHEYFKAVGSELSGEKISIPVTQCKNDLKKKADWISGHIRQTEWLKTGFFNGYYDNNKQRVEGKINGRLRMTLAAQAFPIICGIASIQQITTLYKNVKKYLKDKKMGGFHLNTDFKQEQLALGRAFSFVYADKENGAFFSHMTVMFAYALYMRGFAHQGYEVLDSIYQMAKNTQKSKIYPCLPEYFNAQGRGMYSYLTGSASWFILTMLTQVFGVRGEYGDFVIEPKLIARQFKKTDTINLFTVFCEKKITVKFINPHKKDYGKYSILKVIFNNEDVTKCTFSRHSAPEAQLKGKNLARFFMRREDFLNVADKPMNTIEVILD